MHRVTPNCERVLSSSMHSVHFVLLLRFSNQLIYIIITDSSQTHCAMPIILYTGCAVHICVPTLLLGCYRLPTTLSLQYAPEKLAAAAMFIAHQMTGATLPQKDGREFCELTNIKAEELHGEQSIFYRVTAV